MIKVYPQSQLIRETQFFEDLRFLYMNMFGYIIESRENEKNSIFVEFYHEGRESQPKILFEDK